MTAIRLSNGILKDDVLVVGLSAKSAKGALQIEAGDLALDTKALLPLLNDVGATGKADEVIKIPGTTTRLIIFTGLGKSTATYSNEVLRRAAGAATRALAGNSSATISLPAKSAAAVKAIAEGAALGNYSFTSFRGSTKSAQKAPLKTITIHAELAASAEAKSAVKSAEILARYTNLVRDLINTPPSHLTPETFCKAISDAVKEAGGASIGLKVNVMNESQLKTKGYGGITAVGQGSVNPPRLLSITYTPKSGKPKKKYAFVGKGITFDTGGLALKPALGMEAMKSDMSGAAAVCAATIAIALLELPVAIETWALAKIGPSFKPSPTIKTFLPCSFRPCKRCNLSFGLQAA